MLADEDGSTGGTKTHLLLTQAVGEVGAMPRMPERDLLRRDVGIE